MIARTRYDRAIRVRGLVAVFLFCACGGGGGHAPDANNQTPDGPRAAESDCFNGIDDNGDGLIDCADPTCAPAATCVPSIPDGWSGYDLLFDDAATPPACPSAFSSSASPGQSGLDAPDATCDACTCGAPTGVDCFPTSIQVADAPCGTNPVDVATLALSGGSCYGPDAVPGGQTICGSGGTSPCNQSVSATAATPSGGSCGPSGGAAHVTTATFGGTGLACDGAIAGSGCGAGACLPTPAAPFVSGMCIHQAGDVACPLVDFTARHVFYTGVDDTRGCTACGCSAPTGGTCNATVSVYSAGTANTCTGLVATISVPGCTNLIGNPTVSSRSATASVSGSSCAIEAATPTGAASGTGATTYCCVP